MSVYKGLEAWRRCSVGLSRDVAGDAMERRGKVSDGGQNTRQARAPPPSRRHSSIPVPPY